MTLPLVLASGSAYRRSLMNRLQVEYTIAHPDIDETPLTDESPQAMVQRLALEKARAVSAAYPHHLIISSDQTAVLDGEITGKPLHFDKAFQQLKQSSGNSVIFYTSLCLYNSHSRHHQLELDVFKVHFRELSDQQISNYLHKEQPYDCAGSFKVEGLGICLFKALEGNDPNSLIGLPLIKLIAMLENEGVNII